MNAIEPQQTPTLGAGPVVRSADRASNPRPLAALAGHRAADIRRRQPLPERGRAAQGSTRSPFVVESAGRLWSRWLERQRSPSARRYDLVTVDGIRNLEAMSGNGLPVVSLYLDVRSSEGRRKWQARQVLKHLIDEQKRQIAMERDSKPKERAFESEAERLMNWFTMEYDGTGRSLAVFTASANGFWQAFRLPVPVRDRLVVAQRPYVQPLVMLTHEFKRFLVVLSDKQVARLFVVYMGEIQEYSELMGEFVRHHKAGGWSADKYQRRHDMHVLWHVKRTIEAAERLWNREQCGGLLMGGPAEAMAEVRAHLPKALTEHLAGELEVSLKASPEQVLRATLEIERATEAHVEEEQVEALLTAALGGGPGVLGLDETLAAIAQGSVMVLLAAEDFHRPGFECPHDHFMVATLLERCPLCATRLDPQPDIVERAMEQALEQDATIQVLRSPARQRLTEHGQIGALLRHAV